jgi:hypothetical protein
LFLLLQTETSKIGQNEKHSVVAHKTMCHPRQKMVMHETSAIGTDPNSPAYCYYDYDGDKPFLYSVSRSLRTSDAYLRLPLIYGTIANPSYSE